MIGGRQSENIRHAMVDYVEGHSSKIRPKHWPNLNPIKLAEVLEFKASPTAKYLAVIFEDEKSYIGREVILDMVPYPEFKVARATKNNTALIEELKITRFPSLYVFYPDGRAHELRSTPDPTRESFRGLLLGLIGLPNPPEVSADHPGGAADHPEVGADHPDVVADHPEVGEDHLEVGADHLEVGADHLGGAADHPGGAADYPGGAADHPAVGADHPDVVADYPGGAADHPAVGAAVKSAVRNNGHPEDMEDSKEVEEKIQNYDGNTETNKDLVKFLGMEGMPGMERQHVERDEDQGQPPDAIADTKVAWDAVKKKQEAVAEQQQLLRNIDTFPPVHMQDLESALTYALRQEVPLKETIGGSALDALRNFVAMLSKYFPGRSQVIDFLESLDYWLMDQKGPSITADEWLDFVNENYDPEKSPNAVLPHVVKWEGCLGSSSRYRGYPCSIWTLFHTLTVSSAKINKQNPNGNSQEVLQAMQGYIREFFGCRECVDNYAKESQLMSSTVNSYDTAIVWLWKIHNNVNSRLKGDISEDPAHPKIQFPPAQLCSTCRLGKGHENEWDKSAVLRFLKEYYGVRNIVFNRLYPKVPNIQERDPPERFVDLENIKLKQEVMKRELEKQLEVRLAEDNLRRKTVFYEIDITRMDLSMCIFMYSVCILFCFLIYLAVCRKRRRKTMKQKV